MKLKAFPLIVAALLLVPRVSEGADKTHQQLMAEIRMLQEQQAQLQQLIRGLADSLKVITTRIDDQSGAMRKAFADQKLIVDNVAEGVRILREKADDTSVRLSTMTQEMEAMRAAIQSIPSPGAVPPAGVTGEPTEPLPAGTVPAAPAVPPNLSPQRTYDSAFNDYTGGQYDLAIQGFQLYINSFPTSPRADDAQLNIGNSYYAMGNFKEAVTALQKVINDYRQSDSVPSAYYKLGQSYEALKQVDLARKAYETLIQEFPNDRTYPTLAKQRLDSLNRKQEN